MLATEKEYTVSWEVTIVIIMSTGKQDKADTKDKMNGNSKI